MDKCNDVIALIDLDCFYALCEHKRLNVPISTPLAVVQWNGLIANNYESRKFGVKRGDSMKEAMKKCPGIYCAYVDIIGEDGKAVPPPYTPSVRNNSKVSLELYRVESMKIVKIFQRIVGVRNVERASIDESYLDVSKQAQDRYLQWIKNGRPPLNPPGNTLGEKRPFITAHDHLLAMGAEIINDVRATVQAELGYTCSAGIAHTKKLAKMIASMDKPNGQTILPKSYIPTLFQETSFTKMQGFGGKLGELLMAEGFNTFKDLKDAGLQRLNCIIGNDTASWVWKIVQALPVGKVSPVEKVKQFRCTKNITPAAPREEMVRHLRICSGELRTRMQNQKEIWREGSRTLLLCYRYRDNTGEVARSASCAMPRSHDIESLSFDLFAKEVVSRVYPLLPKGKRFTNVGVGATGFFKRNTHSIQSHFGVKNQ